MSDAPPSTAEGAPVGRRDVRPAGGRLSVVGTPIGCLDDITLRALRVLGEADAVLAEDTRRTRGLLSHHGISARVVSVHAHTSAARIVDSRCATTNTVRPCIRFASACCTSISRPSSARRPEARAAATQGVSRGR